MVNVIKMCLCWDIELIWCVHGNGNGMCNSEIKFWKSNSIPRRVRECLRECECGRWWPNRNMCNGSMASSIQQTSICEHKLTYQILTLALPHNSHNKIHVNSRTHARCSSMDTSKSRSRAMWRQEKVSNAVSILAFPKTTEKLKKKRNEKRHFRPWKIDGWPNTISYVFLL